MRRIIKTGKLMMTGLIVCMLVVSGCSADTSSEPEATRSESEEASNRNEVGEDESGEEALDAGDDDESSEVGMESESELESKTEDEKKTETAEETEEETETEEESETPEEETETDIESELETDPSDKRNEMLSSRLTTEELDLSASLRPEVSSVSVRGKFTGTPSIKNMYNIDILSSELVGLFGCPVEVEFEGESAVLTFTIDEEQAGDVTADDLVVLMLNEDRTEFLELESSKSENTVSVKIDTSGTYMLADMFIWYSVWGVDMSDYAHDTLYRDTEFGFSMTISEYVTYSTVSSYWQAKTYRGDYQIMEKELIEQSNFTTSDMRLSITVNRYPTDDESDNPAPVEELSEKVQRVYDSSSTYYEVSSIETVYSDGEECGYIFSVYMPGDTELEVEAKYEVIGYFYIDDDTYISAYYLFWENRDEVIDALSESAWNSLRSFKYYTE